MDVTGLEKILSDNQTAGSHCRVCCDSRQVCPGDIFVAVRGVNQDGHDFIDQAVASGARFIIAQREITLPEQVSLVRVDNTSRALGRMAQAACGYPARQLHTMAVTGTNGKTTVAYLVRQMLRTAGIGCGLVGTVEYDTGDPRRCPACNTTPDALRLAQMMLAMRHNRLTAMVMECSSHGLDQDRTAGIDFQAAAFTNLTGDHLDYHGDRQSYLAAKSKLFTSLSDRATAILNVQDQASVQLAQSTRARIWRYGIDAGNGFEPGADVEFSARIKKMDVTGADCELILLGETVNLRTALLGEHNISNCLAAAALAMTAGVSAGDIVRAIADFQGVPGRLEKITPPLGEDFTVLVDYAHTDDALENVLKTIRRLEHCSPQAAAPRVILLFGCGGQRDRSKRPRMAKVAEKYADNIILTNDNPRREDPQQIVADILAGFSPAGRQKVTQILDRRQAITFALRSAGSGDIVLIAGKGHEDYQQIGDTKHPFDDRLVTRDILAGREKIYQT